MIHESSHAVMALATGLPFLYLAQSGDNFGLLQMSDLDLPKLKDEQFRKGYLLVAAAGAMGEELAGFDNAGLLSLHNGMGTHDMQNLVALSGGDEAHLLLSCAEARRYLKANWQAVEAVAASLKEKRFLLPHNVKATAGDLPSVWESPQPKPQPAAPIKRFASKAKLMRLAQLAHHHRHGSYAHCAVAV